MSEFTISIYGTECKTSCVDDFLAEDDDISAALNVENQLVKILEAGDSTMRKSAYSATKLGGSFADVKLLQEIGAIYTLVLNWNPKEDNFFLKVDLTKLKKGQPTKRSLL